MVLEDGDVVSGKGIRLGRYLGSETINDVDYLKVFEVGASANHYIPSDKIDELRKLPSKSTVERHLKIFEQKKTIDEGELDGSRYKYFKQKLESVNFKKSLEVLHDLSSLSLKKEINFSEKKMLSELKEKLVEEMVFVLECDKEELENKISFS